MQSDKTASTFSDVDIGSGSQGEMGRMGRREQVPLYRLGKLQRDQLACNSDSTGLILKVGPNGSHFSCDQVRQRHAEAQVECPQRIEGWRIGRSQQVESTGPGTVPLDAHG